MRRAAEVVVVIAAVIGGAFLRFAHLGDVSFWLDEIVSYDVASEALRWPLWRWLSGVEPEHGPLFYALEVAGRFLRSPEWSARLAPALCGVATIAIGWLAARSLRTNAAIAAAILFAVSPLNVYYSREGRPYALLMLLASAIVLAIVRRAHVAIVAALFVCTLYASATGAPLLIATAIGCAIAALLDRDDARRWWTYAASAALCVLATPLLYRAKSGAAAVHFPRFDHASVRGIVESFSVVAIDTDVHHVTALVVLVLAIVGAVDLVRRNRALAAVVIAMTIGTIAITLAALAHLDHWFAIRYLSPALPLYLLLVANGVGQAILPVGQAILPVRTGKIACPTAIAIAIAFVALPAARNEPLRKLDWRGVAHAIWSHSGEGDWVVTTSDWASRSLGFYLRDLPPRVRVVPGPPSVVERWPGTWIVSAGSDPEPAWPCRYPLVLSDRIESLRVRYAPSLAHFFTTHATAAERHALALTAARNEKFGIGFGVDDDPFLVSGWGNAEDGFRWAVGKWAVVFVPFDTRANRHIAFHTMPFGDVPQRVTITLNASPVATLSLARGWHDYAVDTLAAQWRSDGANLLTFDFDAATRQARDPRPLAACFTEIRFDDGKPSPRAYVAHLDGVRSIDITTRRHVNPSHVAPLFASLGVDPTHASAKVETLAYLLADSSACLDDASFVHVARSAILDARDRGGDQYFIDWLREGGTRTGVIEILIDELNRR